MWLQLADQSGYYSGTGRGRTGELEVHICRYECWRGEPLLPRLIVRSIHSVSFANSVKPISSNTNTFEKLTLLETKLTGEVEQPENSENYAIIHPLDKPISVCATVRF